jgi:hypothetical protein
LRIALLAVALMVVAGLSQLPGVAGSHAGPRRPPRGLRGRLGQVKPSTASTPTVVLDFTAKGNEIVHTATRRLLGRHG